MKVMRSLGWRCFWFRRRVLRGILEEIRGVNGWSDGFVKGRDQDIVVLLWSGLWWRIGQVWVSMCIDLIPRRGWRPASLVNYGD